MACSPTGIFNILIISKIIIIIIMITAKTEQRLNSIQRWFVRLILQVGPGAPLPSLYWDFEMLDMKLQVWREKVMMVVSLRGLKEEALAHRIYSEQKSNAWPGLCEETQKICLELNIEDCNTTKLSKCAYRKYVTKACHIKNEEWLRQQSEGKEKCAKMAGEKYGKKKYVSQKIIHNVRHTYRSRFRLQPFAGNYSHDQRFAKTDFMCRCGTDKETESHLVSGHCPAYKSIREKYENFDHDEDLLSYFKEVLDKRDELDREAEKQ